MGPHVSIGVEVVSSELQTELPAIVFRGTPFGNERTTFRENIKIKTVWPYKSMAQTAGDFFRDGAVVPFE